MKRQAETPAARMATSSLRRFSPTKAPMPPKRKQNGSRICTSEGVRRKVSSRIAFGPTSARVPIWLDSSTNWISTTTAEITASAPSTLSSSTPIT